MKRSLLVLSALSLLVGAAAVLAARGPAAQAVVASSTVASAGAASVKTIAAGDSPVVLELFTSQGCSSCPPADEIAARLGSRADLIVITRPVTYWDRLGWKDTLASPVNTELQQAYAARGLAGQNGVFTPQAVIDGTSGTVGSRRSELEGLIDKAAATRGPIIELAPDGAIRVSGAAGRSGRLTLVGLDASESVAIGSGENGARRLTYTNIYKGETDLGAWKGGQQAFAVPAQARRIAGADRYVLLLRDGTSGPILAARRL